MISFQFAMKSFKFSKCKGKTILILSAALLLSAAPSFPEEAKTAVLAHTIDVTMDNGEHTVKGTDEIKVKVPPGKATDPRVLRLVLRAGSDIDRIEANGVSLEYGANKIPGRQANEILVTLPELKEKEELPEGDTLTLKVSFNGEFQDVETARENIKRGVAFVEDGVIGDEGAFLPSSSYWYPQEESGIAKVTLTVSTGAGFTSISEGRWIKSEKKGGLSKDVWQTEEPLNGADIVSGKYTVSKVNHNGIDIYTFFFKKDPELSNLYMEKSKGFLDLYGGTFGPYPFKKFAVVESFLPTGYGMPSFTLLGSRVLRLPFIPDTSLGHEIAHNWWGNSVFPDENQGNWTEAITTYTADYYFAKKNGARDALEFKISKLRGYRNFAGNNPVALKDFSDSTSTSSRAVGYNKGMMVFNMLENALGEEAFGRGLKGFYSANAFKRASWADIEAAFEKASGKDLKWFFEQWVNRAGGPELSMEGVAMKKSGDGYKVSFRIKQKAPPYVLSLPVIFRTEGNASVLRKIDVSKESEEISVEIPARPVSVEIDPDYEVFRVLDYGEVPPSFAVFYGDRDGVIVIPSAQGARDKYLASAELLSNDYGSAIITDEVTELKDYLKEKTVFIFGGEDENKAFASIKDSLSEYLSATPGSFVLNGKAYPASDTTVALAVKNPNNPAKDICLLIGETGGAEEKGAERAKKKVLDKTKRMRYFSDVSWLALTGDKGIEKGSYPGKKALVYNFPAL